MTASRVRRGRAPSSGARLFAVLGVVAATLAWTGTAADAAGSCSAGEPCLVVKVVGNRGQAPLLVQQFSADDLDTVQGMADHGPFLTRSQPGGALGEAQSDRMPALTLTDLMASPDVGLPTTGDGRPTYAEIVGPDGVSHDLERGQLATSPANGFAGGLSPSVWFDRDPISPSARFYRPLLAGSGEQGTDPNDANADDNLTASAADPPLQIVFHKTGGLLQNIKITGPTTVRGATPVQYGVTVPHAPAGLQYQWKVGTVPITPKPTTKPTLTRSWPDVTKPALSALTVDVTAADNSSGSATILVTTCAKKGHTKDCNVKDGGSTHTGGGTTPPTTPPTPRPSPDTSNGGPGASQTPPSPSETGSGPGQTDGSEQTPGAGPTKAPEGDPGSRSGKQQHGGPLGGRQVTGQLLTAAAAFVVPEQRPSVPTAAPDPQPTQRHWSWPWRLAGLLVLPLLIGLGMAGESLPLRRRLARMTP